MSDFPTHSEAQGIAARAVPRAPAWTANTTYLAGNLVWQAGALYRAKTNFTSGASFSATNWDIVAGGGGATMVWLGPRQFFGVYGSTTLQGGDQNNIHAAQAFPDSDGSMSCSTLLPPGWASLAIDLWWFTTTASGGAVKWRLNREYRGEGGTLTDYTGTNLEVVDTAAAVNVVKVTTLTASDTATSPLLAHLHIWRRGSDATDTLTGDAKVLGVMLRKLT